MAAAQARPSGGIVIGCFFRIHPGRCEIVQLRRQHRAAHSESEAVQKISPRDGPVHSQVMVAQVTATQVTVTRMLHRVSPWNVAGSISARASARAWPRLRRWYQNKIRPTEKKKMRVEIAFISGVMPRR